MVSCLKARSLPIILCAVCVLPTVAAAGNLQFELQYLKPGAATVKLTFNHASSCNGAPCREETIDMVVTPCPPGKPCENGEWRYTEVASTVPDVMTLDLTPGETYTFWPVYKERGSTGGQCNWNCSYLETFAPAQYDAPAAPAWTIEPVSSSVDTVWVNAGYSDVDPGCSLTPCQLTEFMRYLITPCPLAIGGSNPNYDCTANYLSYRLYHQPVMVRFALKAGVTYTFGGHMWKAGVCGSGCQKVCCSFTAIPVTAQYTPTPLATRPVTWGKVKALYRSP